MNKKIIILIIGLLFYQPITLAGTFNNVIWLNKEIITSKDPTTFQKLIYEGSINATRKYILV